MELRGDTIQPLAVGKTGGKQTTCLQDLYFGKPHQAVQECEVPGEFIAEPRHWSCTGPWRASQTLRGEGVSQEEEESEQSSEAEKISTHQGQPGPGSPQIWRLWTVRGYHVGPGKPREDV